MTLELILQTKYLRKFLPQLATLVVAKLFDDLRASLAARERQKEDVVQGFERVYAAPLTGPVEHGIQRTATHSWCGATWLRSSQADGPLDRPLGRPVEFAKAGNAAFRVSLAEDQVRAVLRACPSMMIASFWTQRQNARGSMLGVSVSLAMSMISIGL